MLGPQLKALERRARIARRGGVVLTLALAMLAVCASGAGAYNNDIDGVDHPLQSLAVTQAHHLSAHIGVTLTRLHLATGWAEHPSEVKNGLTGTNEEIDGPGNLVGPICEIAINKHWFEPFPKDEKEEVIAHEVFHCFQKEITPEAKYEGNWLEEGLARWVDLTLFPNTHLALALKALTEYYASPDKPLFTRSYDAVGFWAHVQDITGDLWKRIPAIVRAGVHYHNQTAVNAALAGGEETNFLIDWGSSAFDLQAGPTPTWRANSPLGARYWPTSHEPTKIDASTGVALKPFSTAQLKIEPNAAEPLIKISLDPSVHATFGVSGGYVDAAITSKTFCSATNPAECQCPAGYTGTVPPTTPLPSEPLLGAAGDEAGGSVQVTYLAPKTSGYCTPETLLQGRSCEGLLPGFSNEADGVIEKVTGQHIAIETHTANGYSSYSCLLEYKGTIVKTGAEGEEEEYFRGVLAFLPTVETQPTVAAAQQAFQLKREVAAAFANSVSLSTAGIGEESFVQSGQIEVGPHGEECASEAAVRVHNVVVFYGLAGIPAEACGGGAVALLSAVASEL
ncbi:MAG TPA: hypothetical protein VIH71_04430 [Solirubrobacteraceae bacterium]